MIQRIQTLNLFVAVLFLVLCLTMQIGFYEPEGMGTGLRLFNLYVADGNRHLDFSVCPLFVLLSLTAVLGLIDIFLFKNRKVQAMLCTVAVFLLVGWYVVYGIYGYVNVPAHHTFHLRYASCFPLVAAVFFLQARRGIKHDERLVKAADRIR